MERKRLVCLVTILLTSCFITFSFAKSIKFKSGRTVECKILEKTDRDIKVSLDGIETTYYLGEIESIDGKPVTAQISGSDYLQDREQLDKGVSYFKNGLYDDAIAEFTKLIYANPGSAEAYYNRGMSYQAKGNPDQAMSDFTKAIEIKPDYVLAYIFRGDVYHAIGDLDKAISDCSKAIEIDPNNYGAYFTRATVYFDKHEYDKAWEDVHQQEALGVKVPEFTEMLKKASGRDK